MEEEQTVSTTVVNNVPSNIGAGPYYYQQGYQAGQPIMMVPVGRPLQPPGYNSPNPCFCISLRTGCFVLGSLNAVANCYVLWMSVKDFILDEKAAGYNEVMMKSWAYASIAFRATDVMSNFALILAAALLNRCLALAFAIWSAIYVPVIVFFAVVAFFVFPYIAVIVMFLAGWQAYVAYVGFAFFT